jgi:flagellar basal body-associated protein FliL
MKWLKRFWSHPSHRWWIAVISLIIFPILWIILFLFKDFFNPWFSLFIAIVTLILEMIGLSFLMFNDFREIFSDLFSFINKAKNNYIYRSYQIKNKDRDYKGPSWNDDEFKHIENPEKRTKSFSEKTIIYQDRDFELWKKSNVDESLGSTRQTAFRSLWIIIAGVISISILGYFGWFEYLSASKLIKINDTAKGFFTIPVALLGTVVATPVIFIVWLFRDKNNRVQIENARKDTNLKDFQKLSEWASGFHLPEIKQTISTKTTDKKVNDEELEVTTERLTSKEDFLAPDGSNSISRRQGAEALQASAIAQLEAFMFGKYGEQFMQPAFLLIHAIWESIISQQQIRYPDPHDFQKSLKLLHKNPIVSALNKALAGAGGTHLRLFKDNLPSLNLSCFDSHQGLFKSLNISGLKLFRINMSYSTLTGSSFVSCNLALADLMHAKLLNVNLHNANLFHANLSFANLGSANLHGCNLSFANLEETHFQKAKINRYTIFIDIEYQHPNQIREEILSRGAIWDDDPEWLVDKIQNPELLEKIRQDHLART